MKFHNRNLTYTRFKLFYKCKLRITVKTLLLKFLKFFKNKFYFKKFTFSEFFSVRIEITDLINVAVVKISYHNQYEIYAIIANILNRGVMEKELIK